MTGTTSRPRGRSPAAHVRHEHGEERVGVGDQQALAAIDADHIRVPVVPRRGQAVGLWVRAAHNANSFAVKRKDQQ